MQKRVFLKTIVAAAAAAAAGGFATGCTKKPAEIKVGATAGPHAEVVQAAAKAAEEAAAKAAAKPSKPEKGKKGKHDTNGGEA